MSKNNSLSINPYHKYDNTTFCYPDQEYLWKIYRPESYISQKTFSDVLLRIFLELIPYKKS